MAMMIRPQHSTQRYPLTVASVPDSSDTPPLRPPGPEAADCCGGGCARCVFDIHEDALARYEVEFAVWRARRADVEQ